MIRATKREGALLAASLAVVLVAGVAAASRNDDGPQAGRIAGSSPGVAATPSGAVPGAVNGVTPAPGGATAVPGVPAPVAGQPQAQATPPPAEGPVNPPPASAPQPGRYFYRSTTGDDSEESEFVVTAVGNEGGVVRQREKGAFGGISGESTVVWRPDGKVIEGFTFQGGGQSGECDWEPDFVEFKFPLGPDVTWSSSSSCEVETGAGPLVLTQSVDARVVGAERAEVREVPVDVWVIESTTTIRSSGAVMGNGSTTTIEETRRFSPGYGLVIRAEGTVSHGGSETPFQRELLGLTPAG